MESADLADKLLVKAPEYRITLATGVGTAVVTLATAIKPAVKAVLGENVTSGQRLVLLVTAIAAWAIIACTDILARSYVAARRATQVLPLPGGLHATLTKGTDTENCVIAAVQADPKRPGPTQIPRPTRQ
ncbi:MAG: hypothetical protein QOE93_1252 [Actinomycetota bacterium]|nr:hypothetical protein [Actinomycetota bacterium]